jgi:hypothetical protein
LLQVTGFDVLDLRNTSQAGSVIALAALAGRELVNAADLAAERAFTLDLLVGLRHSWCEGVVVDGGGCAMYELLLKEKGVNVDGRGARGRTGIGLRLWRKEDEERWKKAN